MVEITDFVADGPMDPTVIDTFRGRVPDELVHIWEQHGRGAFAQGFLRIVDPKLYADALEHCIGKTQGDGIAIPIMVSGFADLVTWEPSAGFIAIQYRLGTTQALGSRVRSMLRLVEDGYLLEEMRAELFLEAVAVHGQPSFDESFVFVPLLSLGGKAKVENLAKRPTIPAIQAMVDIQGVIGH